MAHSSGGGHSGGGCHGGGGGGGSGSHGCRSSSPHQYHCSRHRFPQSRRYSYLDKRGNKRYVYSKVHPAQLDFIPLPLLLLCIFFLFGLFQECQKWFFIPEKLENPDSRIVIEDHLHVISDPDRLQKDLRRFYEKTGVTPAVLTVPEDAWASDETSLMSFSMKQYYRLFMDEKHWLIVYSAPEDSGDWSFEGIIGDHTWVSIDDWMCGKFTEQTYRNLSRMQDPGKAIGSAFLRLLILRKYGFIFYNGQQVYAAFMSFVLFLIPFLINLHVFLASKKYRNAILDE